MCDPPSCAQQVSKQDGKGDINILAVKHLFAPSASESIFIKEHGSAVRTIGCAPSVRALPDFP